MDHHKEDEFIALSSILNHEPCVPCDQPDKMAVPLSPAHDAVTGAQYLHCLDLREVPRRNLVFSLQLNVDFWQPVDKLSFLVFLSKNTGHLLFQVADDVGVYLKG